MNSFFKFTPNSGSISYRYYKHQDSTTIWSSFGEKLEIVSFKTKVEPTTGGTWEYLLPGVFLRGEE